MSSRLAGTALRRLPIPRALLADRVAFEQPSQTPDGQGGFTPGWSDLATNIRALVLDSSPPSSRLGGELIALGGQAEHVTHRIWMREQIAGLNSFCRVRDQSGKHYLIHDVGRYGGNTLVQAEEVR